MNLRPPAPVARATLWYLMLPLLALGLVWIMPAAAARPVLHPAPRVCPAGTRPMRVVELFFGRAIGGPRPGVVSRAAWDRFAADTLSRALPEGYTVRDSRGAWRDPASGRTAREATKDVLVALADRPGALAPVRWAMAVYRRRFRQHAVGLLISRACGAF